MDWLDLPAVQGTLKGLLQHHSSKASILWRSAFFIVQLSHPYMTPGKTIALVRQQEMTRVTIDILGISELKWTRMGEFNSDDHYIYYCGQESFGRNGVAIIVTKESEMWYSDATSKMTE